MHICAISSCICTGSSTRPDAAAASLKVAVLKTLKHIGRSRPVQTALAFIAAHYLRLVRATTRFAVEPADFAKRAQADAPVIGALWHGQHTMAHFAWPGGMKVAALISRNADAEINAMVLQKLGVIPIRGSGGSAYKMRRRGGVLALREMLRTLESGTSLVLTADVPKVARQCGEGIIRLAMHSGRPIYPVAVVKRWRLDFKSWDRASFGLPFGRGAIVIGDAIRIASHASAEEVEAARLALQNALNEAHARAYALVGGRDPGAELSAQAYTPAAAPGGQSA